MMFYRLIVLSSSEDEDTRPRSKVDEGPMGQSSYIFLSSSDEETHDKVSTTELAEDPTTLEQLVMQIIPAVLGYVVYCTIIVPL